MIVASAAASAVVSAAVKGAVMNPKLELLHDIHNGFHSWRLLEDYTDRGVTVPAGFITNLGSVPRSFWWLVGPQEIAHGAIIHDYLYVNQIGTRKEADMLLRDISVSEVGRFRANLVYYAVRAFGPRW